MRLHPKLQAYAVTVVFDHPQPFCRRALVDSAVPRNMAAESSMSASQSRDAAEEAAHHIPIAQPCSLSIQRPSLLKTHAQDATKS